MVNGIRITDFRGLNKGRGSKFYVGSRVRQTPEEDRRTYRQKRCEYNNKDENKSENPEWWKCFKLVSFFFLPSRALFIYQLCKYITGLVHPIYTHLYRALSFLSCHFFFLFSSCRQVSKAEGTKLATDYTCLFYEATAAEEYEYVEEVFHGVILYLLQYKNCYLPHLFISEEKPPPGQVPARPKSPKGTSERKDDKDSKGIPKKNTSSFKIFNKSFKIFN